MPGIIAKATQSIRHRGPDQQGVWQSDQISVGAVRLKIIDLEGGEQPMLSGDGETVLVFNGEIYNHADLRRELESLGHRFRSRCDTEVVLRAFLEWDTSSFARLRGMFAFAIWVEPERRLVLVRDRMGIKPLYVARHGREIHFGSELKAVPAHPDVSRGIDLQGLNRFLSLNYIPGRHTLVSGVEKLPPGTFLEWRNGSVREEPYWELRFKPESTSIGEAKDELDHLLRSAVKEHLVSDVPLGVWSSGGLDSSTILHYASQAAGRKLKTFSVSFRGRKFDESPWFRIVAKHYGTEHHEFDLNPEADLAGTIERMSYYSDEPSSDAGALPVWFLSQMCRREVTVALSGEGADELFGGYNTYLADRYAAQLAWTPRWTRRAALAAAQRLPASDEKIGFEYKLKRMLEGSLLTPEAAHLFWNGTFSEQERSELLTRTAFCLQPRMETPDGVGGLNRWLFADQKGYLVDDILYKCDRMSMAHSLEVRPPFLDHRIVEFAARLPEDLKIRGSKLKFLLRELMEDKLPRQVLTRRKEGFDIPAHEWFRGPLRPMLLDVVSERAVRECGFLQPQKVRAIMEDHFSRRKNYGYHLWGLLTLFLWINRWSIQTGLETRREPATLLATN